MDATNLARSLQGWVRVRPGGRASRGDCARLCALYGPQAAVNFWRAAMAQAWYVRMRFDQSVHDHRTKRACRVGILASGKHVRTRAP